MAHGLVTPMGTVSHTGVGGLVTGANYRGNHDRLVEVKNRYDPTSLFRLDANVPPTG